MERLDENGFDVVAFKDSERTYKLGMGYDRFKAILLSDFPFEEEAINKYCADMQKLSKSYPMYYVSAAEQYDSNELMSMGAEEYLTALTDNKKLRTVLAGNMFVYAGVAGKTPLYVHALIEDSYIESAYRFIDGGDQIAQQLSRVIKNNSGDILRKHEVATLVEEGGKIVYAEDAEGNRFSADNFISNIHPVQTMKLTDSKLIRGAYRSRLNGLRGAACSLPAGTSMASERGAMSMAGSTAGHLQKVIAQTWGNYSIKLMASAEGYLFALTSPTQK